MSQLNGTSPSGKTRKLYAKTVGVNLGLLETQELYNVELENHRLLIADRDHVVVRNLRNRKHTDYNPGMSEFDSIYGADLDGNGRVLLSRHKLDKNHDIESAAVELYPNADDSTKHSEIATFKERLVSSGFYGENVLTVARSTNEHRATSHAAGNPRNGTAPAWRGWRFAEEHRYGGGATDGKQLFFIDNGGSAVDKPD